MVESVRGGGVAGGCEEGERSSVHSAMVSAVAWMCTSFVAGENLLSKLTDLTGC